VFQVVEELYRRLRGRVFEGINIRVMIRRKDRNPNHNRYTFLGHGYCRTKTKSFTCGAPLRDVESIHRVAMSLYRSMNINLEDLRGFGITATKFRVVNDSFMNRNTLGTWLSSGVSSPRYDLGQDISGEGNISIRTSTTKSCSLSSNTSTPPKWKCKRCTYANSYWLPYCEMCEKKKNTPAQSISSSSSSSSRRTTSSSKRKRNTQITLTQMNNNNNQTPTMSKNIIEAVPLRFSQIDQSTLLELPQHLQDEIRSATSSTPVAVSNNNNSTTTKRWVDIIQSETHPLDHPTEWWICTGKDMISNTNLEDLQSMLQYLEYKMENAQFMKIFIAIQDYFRVCYGGASLSYKYE